MPSPVAAARSGGPRRWPLLGMMAGACTPLLWGCGKGISEATIAFIPQAEVRELQAKDESEPRTLILIDPRPIRKYAAGHIPGAASIQLSDLPSFGGRDPRLAGHSHLIVYGENPGSPTARAMTKRLLALGYTGVRMYPGGIEEWAQADLPVETSELPADLEAPQSAPR